MERYTYARAESVSHALALLNEPGVRSRALAGGTDLLLLTRAQPDLCDRVVDISLLPDLRRIVCNDGSDTVVIGAATTFSEIIASPLVRETAPVLLQACQQVGAVQIRNMGTIGGNVANAAACADSLPALVCLDAVAIVATPDGERRWSVADLVLAPNRTRIPVGGLLVSLNYTVPLPDSRSVFLKLGRRNAMAISRLTVAVLGRLNAEGLIAEARIVPGAATPQLCRFTSAEACLVGQVRGETLFKEAAAEAVAEMIRLSGRRWSAEFKEPVLQALVVRALQRVFGPATENSRSISHDLMSLASFGAFMKITFTLNRAPVAVEAPADLPLLDLLRDYLGLTGTKEGCRAGECGACSVLLDGRVVNSCLTLAGQAIGREVVTIEGVRGQGGGPNDLQQAFIDFGAVQCGFCTPGMVLAGEALLASSLSPNRAEIRTAIAGNLCRCTGYQQIVDAIEATAATRRQTQAMNAEREA